jgi:tetratricopeptide (TPR) repeat protein
VDATQLRQLVARLVTTGDEPGFAVQDQVVAVAEEMLELELTPQERRAIAAGGTEVPEAAQRLLEARGVVGPNPTPNDLGRAAELFRSALELDPAYADAMVGLAEVCERRFEFGEDPIWLEHGLSYAERALDIDPALPGAHLAAGRCELARHAYAEAVKRFERTLELDPLNLPAYLALAAALEDGGEPERAGAVIDRALRTGPDDWQTHHQVGKFLLDERFQPARAMEHFQRVIELLPSSSIGYAARGGCRFYLGDRSGARDDFERAIALGPSYWALHNLATLEYYEGNYAAAADRYRDALAIDDTDHEVWSALAEALRAADAHPAGVREAYRQAAELARQRLLHDPVSVADLVSLASYRAHLGEADTARELLERAIEVGTDNAELMYFIAESAERLGDRELALEWLERALEAGFPLQVIENYPDLAALRADPRYRGIVASVGNEES